MGTPGTVGNGRYLITRRIGQGGMGAVFEAVDTRLGNQVALKQLLLTGDTGTAGEGYMAILLVRIALAAGVIALGAVVNRSWLVPIACTIAIPILWPDSLAILLGAVYLIRRRDVRPRAEPAA